MRTRYLASLPISSFVPFFRGGCAALVLMLVCSMTTAAYAAEPLTAAHQEQFFDYDMFQENIVSKIQNITGKQGDDREFVMRKYLPVRNALQEADPIIMAKKKEVLTNFLIKTKSTGDIPTIETDEAKIAALLIANHSLVSIDFEPSGTAALHFSIANEIVVNMRVQLSTEKMPATFADEIFEDPSEVIAYAKKVRYAVTDISLDQFEAYKKLKEKNQLLSSFPPSENPSSEQPMEMHVDMMHCGRNGAANCAVVAYHALLNGFDPLTYYLGLRSIVGYGKPFTPVNRLGMPYDFCSNKFIELRKRCPYYDDKFWCSTPDDFAEMSCYKDFEHMIDRIKKNTVSEAIKKYGDEAFIRMTNSSTGEETNVSVQGVKEKDMKMLEFALYGGPEGNGSPLLETALKNAAQASSTLAAANTESWQKIRFIHDESRNALRIRLGSPWTPYLWGGVALIALMGGFYTYRRYKTFMASKKSIHHHSK